MVDKGEVTIKWLGHSCFLISLDDALKIVTDPFDTTVGYPMPDETADICVVSHDHFDHNYVSVVKGNPEVVKGVGEKEAKGIKFKGVASFHDEKGGSERGKNTIFTWELGGIRFAHAGDLGIGLSDSQKNEIGTVDVLFVPTGGFYTIDAATAGKVAASLNPKVVIPMHYKTPFLGENFPIAGVDEFLQGKENVIKVNRGSVSFTKENLPEKTTIYVLEYVK
ncbi:MAG: MBL fold metallo-hydrolase [candidate division Zixibacteria bacterium]|nr:MBL fold metallo-hydrolase [candidate division Zixibacteria bacterium]